MNVGIETAHLARIKWLEAEVVSYMAELILLRAENAKLKRYPFKPICLNCGALEPCVTAADLKPGDPGIPYTFDPTPRRLFDENARLRAVAEAAGYLADVLKAATEHPTWKTVFSIAHVRGIHYKGPTFNGELNNLRDALAAL